MKNLFLTIAKHGAVTIALTVLVVGPLQPLIAQADTPVAGDTTDTRNIPAADNLNSGFGNLSQNLTPANQSPVNASGQVATNPPANNSSAPQIQCNFLSNWSLCITNIVYVFTVGIGSGFAYIAAYFFDWTVALSLNGSAYALDFVSQGWTTARDLANMAFLFILLFIAFKIIFEAETNDTVHMLTWVIVIALLVNFSFFFTRLAIDAGNILSIQFYNAISAPSIQTTATSAGSISSPANASLFNNAAGAGNQKDLTASIMGMLNLQGLFSTQSFQNWYQPPAGSTQTAPNFMVVVISLSFLYITAGIMFWLLTVAFVTNGVKFLVRIVVLWFLIIASPLAFVARAVPAFKSYYDKWQHALISHAFYPAAFMFIFLILTNFSNEMGNSNNLTNGLFNGLTAANSNGTSQVASIAIVAANIFIRLGFVIAMLYIGLKASDKIGVMGADAAHSAGNWVGGRMTGAFRTTGGAIGAGVPGWALRNTVGFAGDKFAKSNVGRDLAARGGFFGRTVWRAAGAVGRQSYDARGGLATLGVKENLIGKAGGEGGYTGKFDARVKMREEEAKKLKPSESKMEQAQKKEIEKLGDPEKLALRAAVKRVEDARDNHENIGDEASKQEYKAAKIDFDTLAKPLLKKAKEAAGYDNDKKYAEAITTKNIRNLWGAAQGTPGWIWAADKESSSQIRKPKDDTQRLKNILKM